jgi:putative sterol carrier protein
LYSVLEVDLLPPEEAAADDETRVPLLTTTESVWIDILFGKIQPAAAYTNGQVQVTGSLSEVRQFLSFF